MPRIQLYIPERDLVIIDSAALAAGESRSAFMVRAATRRAAAPMSAAEERGYVRRMAECADAGCMWCGAGGRPNGSNRSPER